MKVHIIVGLLLLAPDMVLADWSSNIGLEGIYFLDNPAHAGQSDNNTRLSLSLQSEYRKSWDNNRKKFTFVPFYRWDSEDNKRTHGDIRELDFISAEDDWEFQVGISKVFWGVAESQHLVDIINQTDGLEGLDGEDKLGQPMLRVSRLTENGSLDTYLLPYFRERSFPSLKGGRFRTPIAVDTDNATYESKNKEKHLDYALRWNYSKDNIDLGLSWFEGTSRNPKFKLGIKNGSPVLTPHYSQIRQAGLDLQSTGEEWIWKLEVINRDSKKESYNAAVGGFEYTFLGLTESGAELGLLAEYHHDSRGKDGGIPFQNDLFIGTRLAMNDADSTEILAGAFVDLDDQGRSFRVEASRRLGNNLKLNIEAQLIDKTVDTEPSHAIRNDDYIRLELQKFF